MSVESDKQEHKCIPDDSDATTCTFVDVPSSFDLEYAMTNMNQNFTSIRRINFEDCFLEHVPSNIFTLYPNVEYIDASGSSLMIFDLFKQKADQLRVINASENHLESIVSQRFSKLKNLESLDLSHNRIARINPYTFVYSAEFKYLNMSYSQLTKSRSAAF